MKIAYLVSRCPKLSETFIYDEISALERRGVEIELFALMREDGPVLQPDAAAFARRCHIASPLSPLLGLAQILWAVRAPWTLLSIWTRVLWEHRRSPRLAARAIAVVAFTSLYALQMRRNGVAHLHAHWATHPALGAWVVHRLTGLPYSFTTHADDLFVHQTMLAEKARRAEFVVAISEYNRRFLRDRLGADAPRIELVHCGVATGDLHPVPEIEGGPFRIACVARLEPKKGQAVLVAACAELVRRGIDVRCDLVGDGSERVALAAQVAALGLSDRVALHGAQPRERALAAIAAATVVALPGIVTGTGRRDGVPVALMEAMALARPVVASALSGVPELVEHERTGLLVEPGNRDALVSALARLAGDPALRARLACAGRARVEAEFDLERSADHLRALFASAAGSAPTYPALDPCAPSEVSG